MDNIYPAKYSEACNLLGRSNVSVASSFEASTKPTQVCLALYATLNHLTNKKPNWRFVAFNSTRNSDGALVATAFSILEDGEKLGSVSVEYRGRGGYKVLVSNERIKESRQRSKGYYTEDPAKAALAIRKYFHPKSNVELVKKSVESAQSVLQSELYGKSGTIVRSKNQLLRNSEKFVEANMAQYIATYPELSGEVSKHAEAVTNFNVVEKICSQFDKGKALLVVLNADRYLVSAGGSSGTDGEPVIVLTNDELTFEMRRKLGLLKLVQPKQMISDIGCKVDDTTFIVLADDEGAKQ